MIDKRIKKSDNINKDLVFEKFILTDSGLVKAVALRYDNVEDKAPIVIAKGSGTIAERIIETAREHDISIVKDPKLTNGLMPVSLGDHVPFELYEAVAQLFVYLSTIDNKVDDGGE